MYISGEKKKRNRTAAKALDAKDRSGAAGQLKSVAPIWT